MWANLIHCAYAGNLCYALLVFVITHWLHRLGTRGSRKLSSFIKMKIPTKTKGTVNTLCEVGRHPSSLLLGVVSSAPH